MTLDTPSVAHASNASLSGHVAIGSQRWAIDNGSCVNIVGEGIVAKEENKCVEYMSTPMRLNAANEEVYTLKVPLRTSMTGMP